MNPARQGKRNVDHMLLNTLAPFGGKEKGAMCAKQERKKSADRECLAGGNKGRHCAKKSGGKPGKPENALWTSHCTKRPKRALSTMIMVMVMVVFVVP